MTRLPSAKTAYPVTGDVLTFCPADVMLSVTGIQVTRMVPSCGPASTLTSIGGSGNPAQHRGYNKKEKRFSPLVSVRNSVWAESFSSKRMRLFSST